MQTRDEASFDQAKSEWDANCASYRQQLQLIRPTLPQTLQDFCDTSLHDGVVTSASVTLDSMIWLEVDASNNPWGPSGKYRLTFTGVHSIDASDDIVGDCWLYEEIHQNDYAAFEYCIMFEGSDFRVVADQFQVTEL